MYAIRSYYEHDATASETGKKKEQIIREAFRSYPPSQRKKKLEVEWKDASASAVKAYNRRIEVSGAFSDGVRSF